MQQLDQPYFAALRHPCNATSIGSLPPCIHCFTGCVRSSAIVRPYFLNTIYIVMRSTESIVFLSLKLTASYIAMPLAETCQLEDGAVCAAIFIYAGACSHMITNEQVLRSLISSSAQLQGTQDLNHMECNAVTQVTIEPCNMECIKCSRETV